MMMRSNLFENAPMFLRFVTGGIKDGVGPEGIGAGGILVGCIALFKHKMLQRYRVVY